MDNPKPMDKNKLMAMLQGAKAVMNKVDSGDYSTGNITLPNVNGDQLVSEGQVGNGVPLAQNGRSVAPKIVGGNPQYTNIQNSKLPDVIKEAMLNNPIPEVSGPNHTFTLDDVTELVDKPIPNPSQMLRAQSRTQVNENYSQPTKDTFTVSETVLRGIIEDVVKEELMKFMTETFSKNLTEQTIKKTINTLIKEGKIVTKKNKVND